jgi:hypothetical protein
MLGERADVIDMHRKLVLSLKKKTHKKWAPCSPLFLSPSCSTFIDKPVLSFISPQNFSLPPKSSSIPYNLRTTCSNSCRPPMTPPPTNENTSHHLQPTPPNAIHQSKKRSSMASLSLSLGIFRFW